MTTVNVANDILMTPGSDITLYKFTPTVKFLATPSPCTVPVGLFRFTSVEFCLQNNQFQRIMTTQVAIVVGNGLKANKTSQQFDLKQYKRAKRREFKL